MQGCRLSIEPYNRLLNGARLMRGDDFELKFIVVDTRHSISTTPTISFRFVAKLSKELPNGSPVLYKDVPPAAITIQGDTVQGLFTISSTETAIFPEGVSLKYDLERTLDNGAGPQIKTCEQGNFSIVEDVAQ